MTLLDMVKEFHITYGHGVNIPFEEVNLPLRRCVILEEVDELEEEIIAALNKGVAHPNMLKEMADVVYVINGLAVELGWDLDEAIRRVHTSNMSKLGEDGKPIYRKDGKVLKGPNYRPPIMKDLI